MDRSQKDRLIEEQCRLAGSVRLEPPFKAVSDVRTVAGLYVDFTSGRSYRACGVSLRLTDLSVAERVTAHNARAPLFAHAPGFLSLRELPALMELFRRFREKPDVVICNGHGIAHPRRFGLASHFGVEAGVPSIGCAMEMLCGEYVEPPPGVRGAYQYLRDADGEILGVILRTKPYVKPVFVSPGNLMNVEMAGDIALACCKNYRMPEPLRLARAGARGE